VSLVQEDFEVLDRIFEVYMSLMGGDNRNDVLNNVKLRKLANLSPAKRNWLDA